MEGSKKRVVPAWLIAVVLLLICACGCQSTTDRLADSAGNKNVTLGGYVSMGEIEFASPETATPQGKMIIGRAEYRSRKVGIPADQKVPTTGFFKATKSTGLLGTEEIVIEYDFTAGSDADAKAALDVLNAKKEAAEKAFAAEKENDPPAEPKK